MRSPVSRRVRCTCGSYHVVEHHYRSGDRLFMLLRCESCNREWEKGTIDIDQRDVVSSEEVISVYDFLKHFDKPLKELLSEQE